MTTLILGGLAQGKTALAQSLCPNAARFDGGADEPERMDACGIVDDLHLLVRRMLERGEQPQELLPRLIGKTVVCTEIGLGIVPIDRTERDWREHTGRLCCDLAAQADRVILVRCGISRTIKGELL